MRSNTIDTKEYQIDFHNDGFIRIVGNMKDIVTFEAKNVRARFVDNYSMRRAIADSFNGTCIATIPIGTQDVHFFFTTWINGDIRNPERVLRAIRSRLINIIDKLDADELNGIEGHT